MSDLDPRTLLRTSCDVAVAVVGGVNDDQWHLPTPCSKFDVRQLTAHLVGAAGRPAAIARGEEIGPLDVGESAPEGGYVAELARNADDSVGSFVDPAVLDREFVLPWGAYSGRSIAEMYAIELTAHAWDLAVATGQEDKLDDAVADALLPAAETMIPATFRGGEMPFEAVVEAGEGARGAERLAAWLGRSWV